MNREELRKFKKKVTPELIKKIEDNALLESHRITVASCLIVLRDKFGFGHDRIVRFMDELNEVYDSFAGGYLNADDIFETIEKECDVKFEMKDWRKE